MTSWMLQPAGVEAAEIAWLWWLMLAVLAAVYVLAIGALAWAMLRRRVGPVGLFAAPETQPDERRENRLVHIVALCVVVTAAVLFAFSLLSYSSASRLYANTGDGALSVEIVGHQWWWEVRYHDQVPGRVFSTANELRLPHGRTAKIALRSEDVIHSFWVPALHGKTDLIPGQTNTIWLTPRETGALRGQCAEFCGLQHAHMAFDVFVDAPDAFERWAESQRQSAREPTNETQELGRKVFLEGPCALCHRIQGTTAGGLTGPDLTHVASRRTIGAGRLPNTPGHRAGWVADAPTQKPGVRMPPIALRAEQFQALLAYLAILE
jgi:cytochrome c oxidase subunit II